MGLPNKLKGLSKMLRKLLGVFALSLMLVACEEGELGVEVDSVETGVEQEQEQTMSEKELRLKEELQEQVNAYIEIQNEMEQEILKMYQDGLGDSTEVEYLDESRTYQFTYTDYSLAVEVMTAISEGDTFKWNELVNSYKDISASMQGKLGDGYSIAITNPMNKDNVLLVLKDGDILYDVMAEQ